MVDREVSLQASRERERLAGISPNLMTQYTFDRLNEQLRRAEEARSATTRELASI